MNSGGPVRHMGLSFRPARLRNDSWVPYKVYKYGLSIHVGIVGTLVLSPTSPSNLCTLYIKKSLRISKQYSIH
jgi:hypothetical protein